ncbi:hypothetical protein B566_EDAN005302 [Ephemera danica]|nr:hypothetical protein B566_EDAN005302 [Ephemera danica]
MATSSKACTTVSRRLQSLPWTPALGLLLLALASHVVLEATAAPASSSAAALADYDTVRELYEMLVRRAAMEEAAAVRGPPLASLLADAGALQDHELVRKSTANRSPSLRLRFGRRADPMLAPQKQQITEQARAATSD